MRIAYFDCFSGISGDMILGALVDAGADLLALEAGLKGLGLEGYRLTCRRVMRAGIAATKVDVVVDETAAEARKWKDIRGVIESASLPEAIREKALAIFGIIFSAEAAVHAEPVDEVHLHELAGTDCMVDIVGSLIGLDLLGIQAIHVSPVNLGSGTVETAHGRLPVPAPATAEILKGLPLYSSDIPFELTTPTGAAILKGLAQPSAMPEMTVEKIGCGAGGREISSSPNILRLFIGEGAGGIQEDRVMVIETNIDDMNPQIYADVMEKLFSAGAMDVWLENIIMKKGRPAVKLTVLCPEEKAQLIGDTIFRETTSIGLRFGTTRRRTLEREIITVETGYGAVRVKVSRLRGDIVNAMAEYEDLKEISGRTGIPIKNLAAEILREAVGSGDQNPPSKKL